MLLWQFVGESDARAAVDVLRQGCRHLVRTDCGCPRCPAGDDATHDVTPDRVSGFEFVLVRPTALARAVGLAEQCRQRDGRLLGEVVEPPIGAGSKVGAGASVECCESHCMRRNQRGSTPVNGSGGRGRIERVGGVAEMSENVMNCPNVISVRRCGHSVSLVALASGARPLMHFYKSAGGTRTPRSTCTNANSPEVTSRFTVESLHTSVLATSSTCQDTRWSGPLHRSMQRQF